MSMHSPWHYSSSADFPVRLPFRLGLLCTDLARGMTTASRIRPILMHQPTTQRKHMDRLLHRTGIETTPGGSPAGERMDQLGGEGPASSAACSRGGTPF